MKRDAAGSARATAPVRSGDRLGNAADASTAAKCGPLADQVALARRLGHEYPHQRERDRRHCVGDYGALFVVELNNRYLAPEPLGQIIETNGMIYRHPDPTTLGPITQMARTNRITTDRTSSAIIPRP